ncbi:hypothetical protein U879_14790 [Defluviimonas sp. 20V17]|uniref:Lipoprotein n=1 Tax=Allgaiera indica TaxID=765699 RepID=A0AAN4ZZ51_9RHOB|nr:hypothetical protein [Allgaiera indica]KDB02942.1 hypothetical protein U879_14790 [Defluviimonas sp. 20V17]GHE01438.1 hypothetical protein GCM10008024_16910 [Allgaiera indica]SDW86762.1 hypothetical protein SAMN05444006_107154 [Allgaiera indica]
MIRRPQTQAPAAAIAALAMLGGCAPAQGVGAPAEARGAGAPPVVYRGIDTVLIDKDLVDFRVSMTGALGPDDVLAYARCAAAQYALIRGFGFARQVRTTVNVDGGVWRADAVYTISAALPPGPKTIDAEVTVRDCGAQGIPTV